MGRKSNPSSRAYPTPTYISSHITTRETFGGSSKAGLGRHIGMNNWSYQAIVNGSSGKSGHTAPPAGPSSHRHTKPALPSPDYPISFTNQLSRIGAGSTGSMTRTPADGVKLEEREKMQERVNAWNKHCLHNLLEIRQVTVIVVVFHWFALIVTVFFIIKQ